MTEHEAIHVRRTLGKAFGKSNAFIRDNHAGTAENVDAAFLESERQEIISLCQEVIEILSE